MKRTTLLYAALLGAGLAVSQGAWATACTSAGNDADSTLIGTAQTSNVTLNSVDSTACDIENDNSGQGGGTLAGIGSLYGAGWTDLYNGSSVSTGPINGITFSNYTFTENAGNQSGTFGFDWSGGPASIDFLFTMHAGGTSGYYFFDDILLSPATGTSSGTWQIEFLNNGGQVPTFSNVNFWAKPGEASSSSGGSTSGGSTSGGSTSGGSTSGGSTGGGGGSSGGTVPEPATLALIGLGLALTSLARRKYARRS